MTGDAAESARQRIGRTLRGKYTLKSLIGVGGMAAVYAGIHRNGNRVAVKVLHPVLSSSADIRSRFLKEGYVANAVDHPAAVRVLDDDVDEDGSVFLVMELLDGETLDARWERESRKLSPRLVAELIAQLLDALAVAHDKGIIHRDIKPENLFLTRRGDLKVLDFGIARMRDGSGASATQTGRMMGTPAFMPREQAMGLSKEIDGRTDLWAVGATFFALVSGKYVHEAETVEQLMIFTATQPARSLATVAPDVPEAIVEVIDRALQFEHEKRWPTAAAMLDALADAYLRAFGASLPGFGSRTSVAESGSPDAGVSPNEVLGSAKTAPALRTAPMHEAPAATPAAEMSPPRAIGARTASSWANNETAQPPIDRLSFKVIGGVAAAIIAVVAIVFGVKLSGDKPATASDVSGPPSQLPSAVVAPSALAADPPADSEKGAAPASAPSVAPAASSMASVPPTSSASRPPTKAASVQAPKDAGVPASPAGAAPPPSDSSDSEPQSKTRMKWKG